MIRDPVDSSVSVEAREIADALAALSVQSISSTSEEKGLVVYQEQSGDRKEESVSVPVAQGSQENTDLIVFEKESQLSKSLVVEQGVHSYHGLQQAWQRVEQWTSSKTRAPFPIQQDTWIFESMARDWDPPNNFELAASRDLARLDGKTAPQVPPRQFEDSGGIEDGMVGIDW